MRVNNPEDVLKVAQSIGCARASDLQTLDELFSAKFSEALKTVGKQLEFEELYTKRGEFKDQLIEVIGRDLNGYILDDAAIDYLEQTPLNSLDPHNILDAQGIRKITKITAKQNVFTNELRQKEAHEHQLAEPGRRRGGVPLRAAARRRGGQEQGNSDVDGPRAERGDAVASDENKKTALVQGIDEGEVGKATQDKQRAEITIAEKNREREVSIEVEREREAQRHRSNQPRAGGRAAAHREGEGPGDRAQA